MTRLLAHEVSFAYAGGVQALTRVSLSIDPGELICVLGPNGAGKSSLLKVLGGLLSPAEGAVEHNGTPLSSLSARERAQRVAVVPQWLARLPDLRVGDFVLGGRYGHLDRWRRAGDADHRAVRAALKAANVSDLVDRGLPTLSGGQRRRVLVARALAQEASFLLVDEPTSELDPEHQLSIFALLQRLSRDGRGVLVVTHDLNLASQYASRLLLLRNGRTAAEGVVNDVLDRKVLAEIYRAPFQSGVWPTSSGELRPFAVPWEGSTSQEPDPPMPHS